MRLAGMACLTAVSVYSAGRARVMSVSIRPGATTLAVMLRPPSSRVTERARPMTPAFDEA